MHLNLRQWAVVAGLIGLAGYHVSSGQYDLVLNDALTILAATHSTAVIAWFANLGIKLPPAPAGPAPAPAPSRDVHPLI